MEIIVGAVPSLGSSDKKGKQKGGSVEARMLNVRPPRRRKGDPPYGENERRGNGKYLDPTGGRVITLMVPEGTRLPRDIEDGGYRVFLRFAPKKK